MGAAYSKGNVNTEFLSLKMNLASCIVVAMDAVRLLKGACG